MFAPVTKWPALVATPSVASTMIRKAFKLAQTERPSGILAIPEEAATRSSTCTSSGEVDAHCDVTFGLHSDSGAASTRSPPVGSGSLPPPGQQRGRTVREAGTEPVRLDGR